MTRVTTQQGLGRLIRERRLELGYTQEELARRVGVARQWILKVEKGSGRPELEPLLQTLFQLGLEVRVEPAEVDDELEHYVQSFTDEPLASGLDAGVSR